MPEKRVVLVTGSSRGIGATLVTEFAKDGFRVVLNYAHSQGEAEALHRALVGQHGADRILLRKANVAKRDEVKAMFDAAVEFGGYPIRV